MSGDKVHIRNVEDIFVVGQQCPKIEVPAPNSGSKSAMQFQKELLKVSRCKSKNAIILYIHSMLYVCVSRDPMLYVYVSSGSMLFVYVSRGTMLYYVCPVAPCSMHMCPVALCCMYVCPPWHYAVCMCVPWPHAVELARGRCLFCDVITNCAFGFMCTCVHALYVQPYHFRKPVQAKVVPDYYAIIKFSSSTVQPY